MLGVYPQGEQSFAGHRIRCQECGGGIAHQATAESVEESQRRVAAKWNRRTRAELPATPTIPRDAIPRCEITDDMPPDGIVRYILHTQHTPFDRFAESVGLPEDVLAERLKYPSAETISWLVDVFGYDEPFWRTHTERGDRRVQADWRRWVRG